ncbi:unnamed protein product [Vicia faba]|uniref:DUF659 domain-containing protein n=1 Tax=Vicia faba TaxID=3906 RepID=A0AAV0ZP31_VICFA|nr:unnamed protein product [Vicia faba]
MMDDIVEEVGEENVIQIVTDNDANYKLAGQMLMEKKNKLCWTPCAAYCIDLMLEDFESKIPMHKDTIVASKKITTYIYARTGLITLLHHFNEGGELIRPRITQFATSYLCLGYLNDKRGAFFRMFTFKQWKDGPFSKTKDGKLVQNTVLDKDFQKNMMADLDVELMHTNGTTSATSPTLAVADEFDIAEDIEESDNEVDDGSDDDDDGGGDGGGDENNEDDNVEIMGDDPSKWRISDLI